jgi:hypothetical protein
MKRASGIRRHLTRPDARPTDRALVILHEEEYPRENSRSAIDERGDDGLEDRFEILSRRHLSRDAAEHL